MQDKSTATKNTSDVGRRQQCSDDAAGGDDDDDGYWMYAGKNGEREEGRYWSKVEWG